MLFSYSVLSDFFQPHALQQARIPCPSPSPGACSISCPLSQQCRPTISSSVVPSSPAFNLSKPQGLFPKSGLFASGGQSIRKRYNTQRLFCSGRREPLGRWPKSRPSMCRGRAGECPRAWETSPESVFTLQEGQESPKPRSTVQRGTSGREHEGFPGIPGPGRKVGILDTSRSGHIPTTFAEMIDLEKSVLLLN